MSIHEWAVRCTGLSKTYRSVAAVVDLDLQIPQGAIFGFLGRNGAGKTTTIRMLTGLAQPTAGAAWVAGRETTGAGSGARAQFGYLPQDPAFYKWMTPVSFLDYVGKLFQMDKKQRQTRSGALLELVGLEDAASRAIRGFSGGMLQRLGIAQALMHEPPVLFLDEPTSALDPAGRYEVLALIERLRGHVTVFLSSHILGDVERVCDTIGIIRHGRLLTIAPRDTLLDQYATNIVLLEFARGDDGPAILEPQLNALPWIQHVAREENHLRLTIQDETEARQALLPFLAARDARLLKYEWQRPSLEDIFLQLSA